MLTEKCKKDFEEWYFNLTNNDTAIIETGDAGYYLCDFFDDLPFSMQYGVYVDFFDENEIRIELQIHTDPTMSGARFKKIRPEILYGGRYYNVGASFGSRNIARESAIKKANEIYNSK